MKRLPFIAVIAMIAVILWVGSTYANPRSTGVIVPAASPGFPPLPPATTVSVAPPTIPGTIRHIEIDYSDWARTFAELVKQTEVVAVVKTTDYRMVTDYSRQTRIEVAKAIKGTIPKYASVLQVLSGSTLPLGMGQEYVLFLNKQGGDEADLYYIVGGSVQGSFTKGVDGKQLIGDKDMLKDVKQKAGQDPFFALEKAILRIR